MPRQKRNSAPLKLTQHKGVGGIAKGCFDALFAGVGKSGHGIQPAAADDANLCLSQRLISHAGLFLAPCDQTLKYKGRARRELGQFGITNKVIDCAGKVVLMVLAVLPVAGGVTVTAVCGTIAARLTLL